MTKPGKCDSCRQRKVKCDEQRPTCGVCRKGFRLCTYSYGKAARFVSCDDQSGGSPVITATQPPANGRNRASKAASAKARGGTPVMLSLRSTREAKSGSGLFQTFVPLSSDIAKSPNPLDTPTSQYRSRTPSSRDSSDSPDSFRLPSPMPESICEKEKLVARWISLVGLGGPDERSLCPMYVFGDWIGLVEPQIWESEAVQSAATCLIDSALAFVTRNDRNFTVARKSNAAALRSIRMAIQAESHDIPRNDILIAIKLLGAVEIFMGAHTQNYRHHAAGLVDLLQRMTQNGHHYDHISQQIYYASFIGDAMAAILGGRDSMFDEPSWLSIPPPEAPSMSCPQSEMAWKCIMQTFVRIPRLVRLVRRARESPHDTMARADAEDLAHELFDEDLEHWVQELSASGYISLVLTARPDLEPYGPECFSFASPRLLVLLTTYWMTRIFISGCVQALCDLVPLPSLPQTLDQAAAWTEDLRAATNIAMCAQYAFKTSPILPVVPLRLQMPILISFGAWHRLEMRELMMRVTGNDSFESNVEGAHAHAMKVWCVEMSRTIGAKWNGVLSQMRDLEVQTESFAGGPLIVRGGSAPKDRDCKDMKCAVAQMERMRCS